jgi:uncharacterized protein
LTFVLVSSSLTQDEEFEWDDRKAESNYGKHGVSFELATRVFADPFIVEVSDDGSDEERYKAIGMVDGVLLNVIYTPRDGRFRLISARRADSDEQDHYFTSNSRGTF